LLPVIFVGLILNAPAGTAQDKASQKTKTLPGKGGFIAALRHQAKDSVINSMLVGKRH
jgi:hypothetical protein